MEVHPAFLLLLLFLSFFATSLYADHENEHEHKHEHLLSSLNRSLIVSTISTPGQVLKTGVDQVTVTWSYNQTLPIIADSNYTTVEVKLCYAPVSQSGRDDRKTEDNLLNDKTCPFNIMDGPYERSNNSFIWTIPRDIPTATYFIRVYAKDPDDHEVAYGQSTDPLKTTNLFQIDGVTDDQVSAGWPTFEKSFGYGYLWLGLLFFGIV